MKKYLAYAALVGVAACSDAFAPAITPASSPLAPPVPRRSESAAPIANQYIVRFRDNEPNPLTRGQQIERAYGAKMERVYTTAIKGASMAIADDAAAALRSDVNVLSVEQDQTVMISTTQSVTTWGLDRIDQVNRPYSGTYTYTQTGAGVTAYIIDTGINFTHNEYAGRAFTGIDEVTNGGTAADCNGHGSHVSGTIGGTTYGIAKAVTLVAVRVLDCSGNGTFSGVIAGIDWVTQHAVKPAVANMSLGGGFSSTLNQAVINSINSGVTYSIAAGNSGGNACLESPSSTAIAITVAASDSTDNWAGFSNFGTCVDIIAPGVNVKSAWIGSNSATNIISGTSMAAPHVAGVAALYLQANPNATPAQVASALTSNATSSAITSVPSQTANKLLYMNFLNTTPPPNQAPVANFTFVCGTLTARTCNFDAGTSTDDHGIVTYAWVWGGGKSKTVTTPTTTTTYAADGVYTVTLTVTDAGGLTGTTQHQVTVGSPPVNQSPSAGISTPANNASFVQGSSVAFNGTGTDPEDGALSGASLVWTSSINGQIGTGTSFSTSGLSVGTHTITLKATDSQGAFGTTTRTVIITAPNQAPSASISAPANNASFVQGSSVAFSGSGNDPEDGALSGASLVWTSSINGQIGTGTSFSTSALSVGTHTITLKATDSQGAFGTTTRTVIITSPNQAPSASISSPANNASFQQGTAVAFGGSGTDPEDGALSGGSLVWTSSINGLIGTGVSFSTSTLSVGTHTITLKATDSQGANNTTSITVVITQAPPQNQPPVASFTWTCVGQPFPHQCFFDGSASTDDHGIVNWIWDWGNGRAPETKTVPTARNTFTATGPGTYQVTLTVKDASGLTNSITKAVVVP